MLRWLLLLLLFLTLVGCAADEEVTLQVTFAETEPPGCEQFDPGPPMEPPFLQINTHLITLLTISNEMESCDDCFVGNENCVVVFEHCVCGEPVEVLAPSAVKTSLSRARIALPITEARQCLRIESYAAQPCCTETEGQPAFCTTNSAPFLSEKANIRLQVGCGNSPSCSAMMPPEPPEPPPVPESNTPLPHENNPMPEEPAETPEN